MHLIDSVGKYKEIEYVCNLHEQACAIGAESYSQYSGNLGVAVVTSGPGGTNAITGIAGAWLDSTPLIIFSGQVKRADSALLHGVRQMGPQEIDIVPMVKPITKYVVRVDKPEDIRYHLEKAVYLAKSGRPGPVWLDIPLDVQSAMIDETKLKSFLLPKASKNDEQLKSSVGKFIALINKAERPVLLAGNGVRLAGALEDFRALVQYLNIPILLTWKSADFLPESHNLYFGRPGIIGQRGANFIQQNSDCIIMLGTRMDLLQLAFNHKDFAREASKVIIDIDPNEIKKFKFKADVSICADAGAFMKEVLKNKKQIKVNNRIAWLRRCAEWKNKYPVVLPEYRKEKSAVNTYILIDVLSDVLKSNDVIVPGSSGQCSELFMQSFKVKAGQRIINTPGLGAMGFGLPASIGACLASGRQRTICINSDGGFQLNIQELETLRRLKLPIKYFILSNGGYASIKATQKNNFSGHLVACDASSGLTLPDIIKLAKAYGIKTARIKNHSGIKQKVNKVLKMPGPVICEVAVSLDQVVAPRVVSKLNPDGTVTSKPMEDMWPFLDRQEFKENMLVKPLED